MNCSLCSQEAKYEALDEGRTPHGLIEIRPGDLFCHQHMRLLKPRRPDGKWVRVKLIGHPDIREIVS